MYIVFKNMEEWLAKDPGLQDKFNHIYNFLYVGIKQYANNIIKFVKKETGTEVVVQLSEITLKQVVIDALDDLLRLKNYHPTESPNPIKEMSYIAYWFVVRKPIRLATEDIIKDERLSEIARTKLLFINEEFGVKLLINSAFEGGVEQSTCNTMLSFGKDQIKHYKHFLLYYLIYRVDSPKSLEAMMLGCTIHPVWEVDPIIWDAPKVSEEDF